MFTLSALPSLASCGIGGRAPCQRAKRKEIEVNSSTQHQMQALSCPYRSPKHHDGRARKQLTPALLCRRYISHPRTTVRPKTAAAAAAIPTMSPTECLSLLLGASSGGGGLAGEVFGGGEDAPSTTMSTGIPAEKGIVDWIKTWTPLDSQRVM